MAYPIDVLEARDWVELASVGTSELTKDFLERFTQHHERIFGYIFSLVHNEQDARDIFQKVSLLLWQKFEMFDQEADFFAWACGVAYNEVRNYFRTSSRNRLCFNQELLDTLATERDSDDDEESDIRLEVLRDCLAQLPQHERDLLMEVYAEGHSIREIAERRGKATQTLYNRLNLIRRKLFSEVQQALAKN
jgi:RNA polymerase sigma factor, sigma-70 family/RNA polymerase sigma-70 factor, Rhodopirellula/Verrucomicrobium family